MSDMRSLALTRAYELVEAGKSEEARTVLEPILLNDRDNVDAWWIYAHAVDDADEARRALDHVIRLDRDYPGATDLLATLNQQYPEPGDEDTPTSGVRAETEDLEPEFADDDSYFEEQRYTPVEVAPRKESSSSWLPIAAVVGIVALLLIALVLILPNLNQPPAPTPTSIAVLATMEQPTAVIAVPATEEATGEAVEPATTEVMLLDITPLGETTVEVTESVEPAATMSAGLPSETEAVELNATASETAAMEVEATPGVGIASVTEAADSTEPGEVEATEAATTNVPAIALGVTDAATPAEAAATEEAATLPAEVATVSGIAELATSEPVEAETEAPTESEAATDEASEPIDAASTEEAEAQVVDFTERLVTALQSFAVDERAVEELETEFGETVVARVCTNEGLELRESLRTVMVLVSNEAETLPENITGLGVRLLNCDMDRTLRLIAVDRESAAEYASDEFDDSEFESRWRAQ